MDSEFIVKLIMLEEVLELLDDDDDDDVEMEQAEEREEATEALLSLVLVGKELRNAAKQATRRYFTRADLLPSPRHATPWTAIYENRSDRSFITAFGFDVAAFDFILDNGFSTYWNTRTLSRPDVLSNGIPRLGGRSLEASGALGMVLHWLCSTVQLSTLQMTFALTPTVCDRYLRFSMNALEHTLRRLPEARIRWPSPREMERSSQLISAKNGEVLAGAFGFVDGLNLEIETSPDAEEENAYYNGWLHAHVVSSVLAFDPRGE